MSAPSAAVRSGAGSALALLLALGPAGGCGGAPEDGLARVREQGFIRAGYAQEPPYAFADPAGWVDGESPAALRHALAAVGVDSIRWVLLDFDALLPALETGRVDVVASGMFATPERREQAHFSVPTFCARAAMVARAGAPFPAGLEAFAGDGPGRVAVVEGSVEHRAALVLAVPETRLLAVPDLATGLSAVRGGTADALALTEPTVRRVFAEGPEGIHVNAGADLAWRAYEPSPAVAGLVEGCSALAFRTSDARLAAAVDEGLARYLGTPAHADVLRRLGLDDPPPSAGPPAGGGKR
jgi:polar amino acid transport system substrate-binding protein